MIMRCITSFSGAFSLINTEMEGSLRANAFCREFVLILLSEELTEYFYDVRLLRREREYSVYEDIWRTIE